MVRKAKRKSARVATPPVPIGAPALAINPFGETQQRKIVRSKVADSEFTLNDGTKLLVRPVLADIRRAVNQYNPYGQPLYFLTIGNSITTKAPKKLLKAVPKTKSKK
jgi:hypothetical protein